MTCSKEVGESGAPHLQFSVTFKRSYSLAALKKNCRNESTGNSKSARKTTTTAVSETQSWSSTGTSVNKDARTDIEEIKTVVKDTLSMKSVVEAATSVQSVRMAELWLKYNEPKRPPQRAKTEGGVV